MPRWDTTTHENRARPRRPRRRSLSETSFRLPLHLMETTDYEDEDEDEDDFLMRKMRAKPWQIAVIIAGLIAVVCLASMISKRQRYYVPPISSDPKEGMKAMEQMRHTEGGKGGQMPQGAEGQMKAMGQKRQPPGKSNNPPPAKK